MKRFSFMLAAVLSVMASSCDSEDAVGTVTDRIGSSCSGAEDCPGLVCAHGICMESTDPCADKTCPDGGLCRNGECQETTELCGGKECTDSQICQNGKCIDLCGNKVCKSNEICDAKQCKPSCGGTVCGDDEICRNSQCVKKGDCGGIACDDDKTCIDNVCVLKGDCGGIACKDGEVCFKDLCYPEGDCGGVACKMNEVCFEDMCYPKGDCGGIECQNGQVCDIYSDICRNPGDCEGVECGENEFCYANSYCMEKNQCGDIYCDGGFECVEGVCVPGGICVNGTERCGEECCTESQFCGTKAHCCEKDNSCGSDCCGDGEVCESEICHIKCEENISRCKLKDGSEVCCSEGEICISNQCYAPKVSCVDDYMCENDEYCESTEKICLPRPTTPVCESKPTGGQVVPTLEWHWGVNSDKGNLVPEFQPNYVKVMSAPMVADIDGDGNTEVVFNSWYGAYVGGGILRIVDGKTGATKYSSNGSPMTDGGSQTAIGDIRKDIPGLEIVTCVCTVGNCSGPNGLKIALYNNKAEQIWLSSGSGFNECGQSGPGIADFDGDGNPEVYSRYNIYNGQTGEIITRVPCGDTAYWHQNCDYPTHADFDGDGLPELIGGNVVYKVDVQGKKMTELWKRSDQSDGYPAVADLDLNGSPEIVVVRPGNSTLMAYKSDGSNFWEKPVSHTSQAGGPPTIANINDTPNPEITFAGKYSYITFDYMGNELWQKRTHDFSSSKTGSSVFDFDGDGKAEIVYADECFLRVYDGENGKTRFCTYNTNGTHWEYPVIADINNDDHAEILVSANPYGGCGDVPNDHGLDECTKPLIDAGVLNTQVTGLRAFSSPNNDWVNTRKIYNQHAYSITNVSDDGTIPVKMRNNWSVKNLNNFRLNVQPGATYMPDLEIKSVSSPRTCTELTPIYFEVVNVGWAAAEPGIKVHVFASSAENGEYIEVGTASTTKLLRASESETVRFDYPKDSVKSVVNYIMLKFDDSMPNDCNADNNSASYVLDCTVVN